MSRWRPISFNCLYVIGDIHGQLSSLNLILSRILPLRHSDGGRDKLIFLGDYIDRHPDSPRVVDLLIDLKIRYADQIIFLRGNHEDMILNAMKPSPSSANYLFWMKNGGEQTLKGYLERASSKEEPFDILRCRLTDLVPKTHKTFFESLPLYYETPTHIFVHAGCDPLRSMDEQKKEEYLLWDRDLCSVVLKGANQTWPKTIVTGHNGKIDGMPYIGEKFMMLDGSYANNIIVAEMNSKKAFLAKSGNSRMIKII